MAAKSGKGSLRDRSGSLVDGLARKAITEVNSGSLRHREKRLDEGAKILVSTALAPAAFDLDRLCREFEMLRLSHADVLDLCLPAAMELLGDGWMTDRLSFASVSTASARMFGLCKHLAKRWDESPCPKAALSLLVATVGREDHIIGPTLLTDQLRRRGHFVSNVLNANADAVKRKLVHSDYTALLLSVGSYQTLDLTLSLIAELKAEGVTTPILLGGAVLDFEVGLEETTGADLVTNDIETALQALAVIGARTRVTV